MARGRYTTGSSNRFGTLDSTHSELSQMDNSGSPYFLHNGDHPGLNLVSHHLTDSNYKLGVGPCQWFSMRITNSDSSMAQFDDLLLEIFSSAHGLAASVIRSMATHLVTSLSLNLSLHHLIPTKQPWSHTTGLHPWIPDLAKFLL
ncbi:hypothetical protein CK203_064921 [Vitis vinifera]|uniref:Uncharacterized protein n=1 Tax=Vitis vinifera TaxID=29760 RepID=A0A438FQ12_VITVI|nr:hypothetical protein CK203_064921 [Vitis vinifera]